jgi:hypothetical protein
MVEQKINENEFENFWMNQLTERQRKNRSEVAFRVLRTVAEKQLKLLKNFLEKQCKEDLRCLYYYETLKNIWENSDFVLSIGKGRNGKFAFYPARTIMENTFRLCKRHYDFELSNGQLEAAKEFEDYYNKFSQGGDFSDINTVRVRDLEPFPNMKELTNNSKIENAKKWYFHYQVLAETSHGKYMHIVMMQEPEARSYRLSLMYLMMMCIDVLKNADFHLGHKTRSDVVAAIQKAESIIKKPLAT